MSCLSLVAVQPASALDLRDGLAQFETGATKPTRSSADYKIGTRKEISRFQILPAVWRQYSTSKYYHDPDVAWAVAKKILCERERWFRQATSREWDYVDLYLMWNAPGEYQRARFDRKRVSRIVLQRAQRFSNLMHVRTAPLIAQNSAARN